jgi:sugar fermentation stimulation protein A
VIYKEKIIRGRFIKRPNRFIAHVDINGEEVIVHVPNTGRCKEILIEGCTILLKKSDNPNRKTKYSLLGAYKNDKIIHIDSQEPNKVVEEALFMQRIEKLKKYHKIEREKKYGNSRFDFRLSNENEEYYLEVKGVTLELDGICKFPDAPTQRGTKHLLELIDVVESGRGAGVIFLIQMDDIIYFTPNKDMDKNFSDALIKCRENGVDIFAYKCKIGEDFIELYEEVDVVL